MAKVVDYVLFDTTTMGTNPEWEVISTVSDLDKEYPECTTHQVTRSTEKLLFLVTVQGYMESREINKYVDDQIRELKLKIRDKVRNKRK